MDKDGKVVNKDSKIYRQQYIWGQLVGWFKQTVNNPEASLSQDRRGTLSYPSFESSFKVVDQKGHSYPFQKSLATARKDFLKHLKDKPAVNWPPKDVKWSFKNSQKCYGTAFFEAVENYQKFPNYLEDIIDSIDKDFSSKLALFCQFEEIQVQEISSLIEDWEQNFDWSPLMSEVVEEEQSRKRVKRI